MYWIHRRRSWKKAWSLWMVSGFLPKSTWKKKPEKFSLEVMSVSLVPDVLSKIMYLNQLERRVQRLQSESRRRRFSWIFLISLFFSLFSDFFGVKMVSPKKGWEFADASECSSFHYRNSSLYNTGLFNTACMVRKSKNLHLLMTRIQILNTLCPTLNWAIGSTQWTNPIVPRIIK